MECATKDNGQYYVGAVTAATARRRGVKRKLGAGSAGGVRLGDAAAVRREPPRAPVPLRLVPHRNRDPLPHSHAPDPPSAPPFINSMDEISYWIYTKRAPCLMNYDNQLKKQSEQPKCSKLKLKNVLSTAEDALSPKKKKKRKLSILEDDQTPVEKQKNFYFDVSQDEKQNQRKLLSSKSGTIYSDIDFNIKNSSVQGKPARLKLRKNSKTTLHKKNKVITSTPKAPVALRRSLRNARNSLNNNSQLNVSYEVLNCTAINGHFSGPNNDGSQKPVESKVFTDKNLLNGNLSVHNKKNSMPTEIPKKDKINGQFEDLSDVSGFTANYIRSTKLHSTKTPRNLRNKTSRNLVKESQRNLQKEDSTMIVCVNKSMNTTTELPNAAILNTSTDSSQNVFNLITMKDNGKCLGVNRSTSLLKFVDGKTSKNKESGKNKVESNQANESNLNITFQSRSSAMSRYPKRHKLHITEVAETESRTSQSLKGSPDRRKKVTNNFTEFDNSGRKENPEKMITRARSGRSLALKVQQPKNSVLVLSNLTEQVSSVGTMNVASPEEDQPRCSVKKKKRSSVKYTGPAKKSVNKSGQSLRRDSLRDRSGFAACFSDSDNDSEPLKQRKFFC